MASKKIIDNDILLQMLKDGKSQHDAAVYFKVSPTAISKRLKRLSAPTPESIIEAHGLTEKQAVFAIERAKGKNATQAALTAYEVTSLDSAKNIGSTLMKQPEVVSAIEAMMNACGLTKEYRIHKLKTHVDNRDPDVSLRALDISFKLDKSYGAEAPVVQVNHNVILADSRRLDNEIARLEAEIARMEGQEL